MAQRNDSHDPTAPAASAAVTPTSAASTSAAPAAAAPSGAVPQLASAPALVPTETPHIDSVSAESAAPEVKLPPVVQLVGPPPGLRENENRAGTPRPGMIKPPAPRGPQGKDKPKSRFPLLAATLALAAGIGGAAGATGIPVLVQLAFAPAPAVTPAQEAAAEIQAIRGLAAQLASDLGAFRATVEQTSRATAAQFGKLAERLDRAQTEPGAKLAKIGEAVERLERRAALPAHEVTGSINAPQPHAEKAEKTEKAEAKPKPVIIDDYVVRKVFDGVALVEGRRGIVEVEPGSNLPGAGRVEEIRRQDGRWVVVTSKGLIVPAR
jgi:hypothetical protein